MRDSKSVISNAVKGIDVSELAVEMDVSSSRMYGVRLIQADMNTMFAGMLEDVPARVTEVDLHREAYEAVHALISDKCVSDQARELRELIAVSQTMLSELNHDEEMTPREVAKANTVRKFARR